MADFTWLDFDDRRALTDALLAVGLVDDRRAVLLGDLPGRFRYQLRDMPDPLSQLQSDIAEINQVERLADGQVPMQLVLRRADAEAQGDPAAQRTIRRLRAVIEQRIGGQPVDALELDAPLEIPEAIVHQDDMVDFGFLVRGAEAGAAVARLMVTAAGGQPRVHRGTGWIVGPGLVLTCHHVVRARLQGAAEPSPADLEAQVAAMDVRFDLFDDTAVGDGLTGARLVAWAPAPLDYALIAVDTGPRRPLLLDPTPIPPDAYVAVNILQHPEGRPLRVALRNNVVAGTDPTGVRYYTDTLPGASGAPVCDDRWRVRAMHRGTRGTASVYAGKRVSYENIGTPIGAVLDDLARRAPEAAGRITAP